MPISPLENGQFIIWLTPKQIKTKDGKELSIIEGSAVVDGKEYDISCFQNTSAKGTVYLKGKFKEPWKKPDVVLDDENKPIPF